MISLIGHSDGRVGVFESQQALFRNTKKKYFLILKANIQMRNELPLTHPTDNKVSKDHYKDQTNPHSMCLPNEALFRLDLHQ